MTDLGPLLLVVLATSLLGSLHCLGMCGGLVGLWAGRTSGCGSAARAHLGYHLGRAASYGAVGLLAGGAGALIDAAGGSILGFQRLAALVAGALVLGWGGVTLLRELGLLAPGGHAVPLAGALGRLAARAHRALLSLSPARHALLTGLLTPLLPCGWLWLFALAAAGSGGAAQGAAVMLAFFAGTVPPLLGLGLGLSALAPRLRPRLRLLGAAGLVVTGALSLFGRGAGIAALPRAADQPASPAALASAEPCCCVEAP